MRKIALLALCAGLLCGCASYSVVILGDTHYDVMDPEVYHAGYTDPKPAREAAHRREFARNGKMWAGRCRRLVKRAAGLVGKDTRYVLQVGDLTQGDTADSLTHVRFLNDAMNFMKAEVAPDVPFVTVPGNHDLRGNDDALCRRAYKAFMPERMSRELGQEISSTNFLFRCGPDAFVAVNFTKPDVEEIRSLLEQARGARHVFVLIHAPVFPYDDSSYYWILLGNRKDSHAAERREMRKLLASLNAIVLCGHTHNTEFLDWEGDGGRITQMTMSSVWSNDSLGKYNLLASGADSYGSLAARENGGVCPAIFDEYRPGVRRYSIADSAGSYKLIVSGERVYVDFYAGDSVERTKRFVLR